MMKLLLRIMLSCIMFGFLSHPVWAGNKQIVLAATEYPPYYGEKLPNHGWVSELITTAYQQVGYEVKIQFFPWKRSVAMVEAGEVDGIFSIWYRPEREQKMLFSSALPANQLVFYKRKQDQIRYTDLASLRSYRIGVVNGYVYPPAFVEADYLRKEYVTTDVQNIKKLLTKRLDLIVIDKDMAQHLLRSEFSEYQNSVESLNQPLEITAQYLAISKRTPDYQRKLDDFNRGLTLLMKAGLFEKIRAKHGF